MNSEQRFAKLREYLVKPSEEHWTALLALLKDWEGKEDFEVAVDYAREHLNSWPDELRLFYREYEEFLALEEEHYQLKLIKKLKLKPKQNWIKIGDEGAKALANSPHLQNLTSLDLSDNDIGVEGAIALTNSPHLQNLTNLNLKRNQIGDEGATAIVNSPHLKCLGISASLAKAER